MTTLLLATMLSLVVWTQQTPPGDGLQFTIKVEAAKVGEGYPTALPAGRAEMEVVTDGKSVVVTLHGQMGGLPDGLISLTPAGGSVWYRIDPQDRTYQVKEMVSPRAKAGESARIVATQIFDTIDGHRAQKFLLSSGGSATDGQKTSPGRPQTSVIEEVWCSSEFKIPSRVTEITNPALAYLDTDGARQFARSCPLALKVVQHVPASPDAGVVRLVTSIRRVSPSPDAFKVPPSYRRLQ